MPTGAAEYDPALLGEFLISNVIQHVAELPDRTSPDDAPDMMLVTADELTEILRVERGQAPDPTGRSCADTVAAQPAPASRVSERIQDRIASMESER